MNQEVNSEAEAEAEEVEGEDNKSLPMNSN